MNKEFRDQWVTALRSGQYRQGRGKLRTANNAFCCLGVACDIARKLGKGKWKRQDGGYAYSYLTSTPWDCVVPPKLRQEIGLEIGAQGTLAEMNDGLVKMNDGIVLRRFHGASFEEIADWIERNL